MGHLLGERTVTTRACVDGPRDRKMPLGQLNLHINDSGTNTYYPKAPKRVLGFLGEGFGFGG